MIRQFHQCQERISICPRMHTQFKDLVQLITLLAFNKDFFFILFHVHRKNVYVEKRSRREMNTWEIVKKTTNTFTQFMSTHTHGRTGNDFV
jgi:hypothetical protein